MTTIAVFVGSLRADSTNKKLAKNLEQLAPEGVRFEYVDLNLPIYNQDEEADYPTSAQNIKDVVEKADGVLFVTPEYNRSIPAVLKNAIDWASRPKGTNSFAGKPAATAGAGGVLGTAMAQSHLRHIAAFLDVHMMSQPELYLTFGYDKFDEHGKAIDEQHEKLQAFMKAFIDFVNKTK